MLFNLSVVLPHFHEVILACVDHAQPL